MKKRKKTKIQEKGEKNVEHVEQDHRTQNKRRTIIEHRRTSSKKLPKFSKVAKKTQCGVEKN